jgi:hypothetical protein
MFSSSSPVQIFFSLRGHSNPVVDYANNWDIFSKWPAPFQDIEHQPHVW